ncbi:hypothetical protein PPK15_gp31 [Bacillus phage 000TH010]|uniref:Uncharacterized protein n=1 Tax=Bacillus phage 000TH010 TaxID=2601652 RepID=A0A5P8PHU1_9CAUD|nr:hypothetical protein PPK15_gp31 [Bacillus phage 000TH010]QFR56244.1 hypothetical protein 000TH010_31 [Bacillus phage 000TH010]
MSKLTENEELYNRKANALNTMLGQANDQIAHLQAMYAMSQNENDQLKAKIAELENKLAAAGMPEDLTAEEGQSQPE